MAVESSSMLMPFKRFRFEFVFDATWLKPGVNEIKSAAIVSGPFEAQLPPASGL
jgi:hypothetical protein